MNYEILTEEGKRERAKRKIERLKRGDKIIHKSGDVEIGN